MESIHYQLFKTAIRNDSNKKSIFENNSDSDSESDVDSDDDIQRHQDMMKKHKENLIHEQMISSLPKSTRFSGGFRKKLLPEHKILSQAVTILSKPILLSCYSILSNDDEIPRISSIAEKVFLNHRPLPTNKLIDHVLEQYPNENDNMDNIDISKARIIEKQHNIPIYMCAIRIHGHVIRRPEKRPTNFIEVLKDPIHIEFFTRFLKCMNSEGPLNFWKSVEALKNITDNSKRQIRIKQIMKKFFSFTPLGNSKTMSRLSSTFAMLQCNADIIRDIVEADINKINLSILSAAQQAVQRSLEKNWSIRYYKTFPECEHVTADNLSKIQDPRMTVRREDGARFSLENKPGIPQRPSSYAWKVFTVFIRRSARFIKAMENDKIQSEFRDYLKEYSFKRRIDKRRKLNSPIDTESVDYGHEKKLCYEIASRTSSVCKIYPYHIYDSEDASMNTLFMEYEMVCGKHIYPDLLVNDLDFWLEVRLFQKYADNWLAKFDSSDDNIETMQKKLTAKDVAAVKQLRSKIKIITHCYLHSHIPPRVRVNADHELARTIQLYSQSLYDKYECKQGKIDRSTFHEIILQIFPSLIMHWAEFCREKNTHVSKKDVMNHKQVVVKRNREKILASQQRKRIRLLKKHNTPGASLYATPCSSAKSITVYNSIPFKRKIEKILRRERLYATGERINSGITEILMRGKPEDNSRNISDDDEKESRDEVPVLSFSIVHGKKWTRK